ncbi:amidohydrolase [Candidatus Acetothermia bacterium]|nr:amidohydrolase [Candidatus Acetothermia bacterium]
MTYADLVFTDGKILSSGGDFHSALAVTGEIITAVGRREEIEYLIGPQTEIIDLKGRVALPGFIDGHTHFIHLGLGENFFVDLSGCSCREGVLAQLSDIIRARGQGEWIIGQGWDESCWPDNRYLSREELDRIGPHNPIAALRIDGHLISANTLALRNVKDHYPATECDLQTGILREQAVWDLLQQIEPDQTTLVTAVGAACRIAASYGVTSIHDMAVRASQFRAYQSAKRNGSLTIRTLLYFRLEEMRHIIELGMETGFGDHWLRCGGIGELFVDGSIGAQNAALDAPYCGSTQQGRLNFTSAEVEKILCDAEEARLQTAIHAIGEEAISVVLAAHATAGTSSKLRHRIEHLELILPEQIEKMAQLNLVASMQPNFVGEWSGQGKMYEKSLGKERDRRIDPHHTVSCGGVPLVFGSDCMPFSPLYGIHWAVNSPHPDQRLTVKEAIEAYTERGAYASFEEGIKGELSPGKFADIVVPARDPYCCSDEINTIEIDLTCIGGKIAYQREESDQRLR